MDDDLKKYLTEMEVRLFNHVDQRIDRVIDHVDQRVEKVETTLLTEFHKWGSPIQSRLRTHRSWFSEIDAQMEALN